MNLGAFRKFIGSAFIRLMLFLWHFTCLMYPLYNRFNDNKVFVGQPIQQRIHTPPYGTFDGIPTVNNVKYEVVSTFKESEAGKEAEDLADKMKRLILTEDIKPRKK